VISALGVEEAGIEDQVEAIFDVFLNGEGGTTVGLYLTSQVLMMKVQRKGKWFARSLFIDPACSLTANTIQWYISINAYFNSYA
jgi:hypothetical protein